MATCQHGPGHMSMVTCPVPRLEPPSTALVGLSFRLAYLFYNKYPSFPRRLPEPCMRTHTSHWLKRQRGVRLRPEVSRLGSNTNRNPMLWNIISPFPHCFDGNIWDKGKWIAKMLNWIGWLARWFKGSGTPIPSRCRKRFYTERLT